MNVYDKKVLIVDDEPGIIKLVKLQLQQAGFKPENIYEAAGAQECVEKLSSGLKADLVILDIMMPGKDGFWAIGAIKTMAGLEKVRVIFYTALPEDEVRRSCRLYGADGYILKGSDGKSLADKAVDLLI
jgi:CheY-like chemotaxis protein